MVFNCVANLYQKKNIAPFIYTILYSPAVSSVTTFVMSKAGDNEAAGL